MRRYPKMSVQQTTDANEWAIICDSIEQDGYPESANMLRNYCLEGPPDYRGPSLINDLPAYCREVCRMMQDLSEGPLTDEVRKLWSNILLTAEQNAAKYARL